MLHPLPFPYPGLSHSHHIFLDYFLGVYLIPLFCPTLLPAVFLQYSSQSKPFTVNTVSVTSPFKALRFPL